jgi:hypothetical protein
MGFANAQPILRRWTAGAIACMSYRLVLRPLRMAAHWTPARRRESSRYGLGQGSRAGRDRLFREPQGLRFAIVVTGRHHTGMGKRESEWDVIRAADRCQRC